MFGLFALAKAINQMRDPNSLLRRSKPARTDAKAARSARRWPAAWDEPSTLQRRLKANARLRSDSRRPPPAPRPPLPPKRELLGQEDRLFARIFRPGVFLTRIQALDRPEPERIARLSNRTLVRAAYRSSASARARRCRGSLLSRIRNRADQDGLCSSFVRLE